MPKFIKYLHVLIGPIDNQKLATECWNLHRSLLEENSKSTFIKDKLLNYKKGVLKLELDLNESIIIFTSNLLFGFALDNKLRNCKESYLLFIFE